MDELRFHLDGVVRSKSEYVDFDGPLELILQLLSRNRVEIQDIRISALLEQYLDYLAEMRRMDLEIASEFVAMASYLTYIKAKTVLAGTEPVEELDELKNSLEELRRRREYERAKHMADLLAPMAARGEGLFVKQPEPLGKEKGYRYQHEKGLFPPQPAPEKPDQEQIDGDHDHAVAQHWHHSVGKRPAEVVDRQSGIAVQHFKPGAAHFCNALQSISRRVFIPSPLTEDMNTWGMSFGRDGSISFSMLSSIISHLVMASTRSFTRSSGL